MSSKDSKGSSDSLPTKTKKKDKPKKESKKEKKEKKEKSKKRDSKDLESDSVNDNSVEIEEGGKEDSSPKSKKFGFFRVSGRKSKSDKRNSKHGSSDSLKRRSVDSADFESRGSEYSLEESTASGEVSTSITEMSTTSTEVSTTITEVPTTSAEVLTTKVEISTTRTEVDKSSEIAKPRAEEVSVVETSSEVKIVNAAHPDLAENADTEKTGTEQTEKADASTKQDSFNEELAEETWNVESVGSQEQTPAVSEVQSFEFKLQSSAIPSKVTEKTERNEEQTNREEENKKENVQLVIEGNVSTHEKDQVTEPESGHKYEVSLEDVKTEQDREITSSEDDSVDTVISTEALNNKGMGEINEDPEIGLRSKSDVEEPIISIYQEKRGPLQNAAQELPPIDEDAIVLSYENKTQDEVREEQHVQEEPVTLASKERREDLLMSEITFQQEPVTEAEPVLVMKSEKVMMEEKIHGEEQAEERSEEELLKPTFVQRKGVHTEGEEEQERQEVPVNEEAMTLSYPDKEEDQLQNGPIADKEELVVLAINEKKGNQIEEQIEEFLKRDAKIEESSTQESKTVKKDEEVEKISAGNIHKTNESSERKDVTGRESSPFDKRSTFITSTPKRESINTEQGTRADGENEEQKAAPAVSYDITRFREGSVVEFHLKVQIVNNIKDAKMSTRVLLAHLAEINKKLRMLQKELLEVQKGDGDGNNQPNVTQVSAET